MLLMCLQLNTKHFIGDTSADIHACIQSERKKGRNTMCFWNPFASAAITRKHTWKNITTWMAAMWIKSSRQSSRKICSPYGRNSGLNIIS